MLSENGHPSDFKDKLVPHVEVLLKFALCLTKNGRDAARLLRESVAEAYRVWFVLPSEEECGRQMHAIIVRRFLNEFSHPVHPQAPLNSESDVDSFSWDNQLMQTSMAEVRHQAWQDSESNEDVLYLAAIADLPAVFRSAMILSYIEGFSNREIADLAFAPKRTVESLLDRGRGFIREELFAHLMGDINVESVAIRKVGSG